MRQGNVYGTIGITYSLICLVVKRPSNVNISYQEIPISYRGRQILLITPCNKLEKKEKILTRNKVFKKARGYWLHALLLLPSIAKHNLSIQGLASKTKITYLVFIWYDLLTSLMVISIY